jgi:hypothetical protein
MGMSLSNQNSDFYVRTLLWCEVLNLAMVFGGWQPMGVQLNIELLRDMVAGLPKAKRDKILSDAERDKILSRPRMSYSRNDGDIMLAQDASNLADALTSVLDDIPSFEIREPANQLEYFAGPLARRWLRDLIAFLRGGDVLLF